MCITESIWLDVILLEQAFHDKKTLALSKLQEAIEDKKVDVEVLDLVHLINSYDQYYTTSSCAGRFVILSKGSFRGKYSSRFVFKTHSPPINKLEVQEALSLPFENYLYINVEPPTFHVACRTLEDAILLHQLAIDSNIGYSMFKTIKKSIVVEIRGTGNLAVPIAFESKLLVSEEYLTNVISLSNDILTSEQSRIEHFKEQLPLTIKQKE